MIKYYPKMFTDEILFSYLSRMYAKSGYSAYSNFSNLLLEKPTELLDPLYINKYNADFLIELNKIKPFKDIIIENTLFGYYSLFLNKDKYYDALDSFLEIKQRGKEKLLLPKYRLTQLRYCPCCIIDDRNKYGECYMHRIHQIKEIEVCPSHCCRLLSLDIYDSKVRQIILKPLEELVQDNINIEYLDVNSIEVKVAKYIAELLNQPRTFTNSIADYLDSIILDTKYSPPRGGKRQVRLLAEDLKVFYKDLINYEIDKNRLSWIFRNMRFNPYEIILIAIFFDITPKELNKRHIDESKTKGSYDKMVLTLYQEGNTITHISRILNVHHQIISNIVKGQYTRARKKRCCSYKTPKFNWEEVEKQCLLRFDEAIEHIIKNDLSVTKKSFANYFKLKDKSLRNLRILKLKIRRYKNEHRNRG